HLRASAPARLADVVRGALGPLRRGALVPPLRAPALRGLTRGPRAPSPQPVPRQAAPTPAGAAVPVPVHQARRPRLVDAPGDRALLPPTDGQRASPVIGLQRCSIRPTRFDAHCLHRPFPLLVPTRSAAD